MEITFGNKTITITEETWGWYQFIERLKNSLLVNDQWESEVLQSPFEYNETIVYERADRKMPAQSNFFSTVKGCTEEQVRYLFQTAGWTVRRPSLKAFELKKHMG
jgi:hypothetical protein